MRCGGRSNEEEEVTRKKERLGGRRDEEEGAMRRNERRGERKNEKDVKKMKNEKVAGGPPRSCFFPSGHLRKVERCF